MAPSLMSARAAVSEPTSPEAEMVHGLGSVVLVSFGVNTRQGNTFLQEAEQHGFEVHDVRRDMPRDPSTYVKHGEDGTSENVQRAIFQQEGFPKAVLEVIEAVWKNPRQGVHCSKGLHRANVIARMAESVLNTLVDENGQRLFNCKHFPLCHADRPQQAREIIDDAVRWVAEPWCVMPLPVELFGIAAATENPRSMANWQSVVDTCSSWYKPHVASEPEEPPASPAALPADTPQAEPPQKRQRTVDSPSRAPGMQPRGSAGRSSYDVVGSAGRSSSDVVEESAPAPPWVSFNKDAMNWDGFMKSHGLDEAARQEVFLLATHSDPGWRAANSFLTKLIKKHTDGDSISTRGGRAYNRTRNG